jgi:hypothetical protein
VPDGGPRTSAAPRRWRRGASAPERAHHVEASARTGDLAAVTLLSEAAAATAPRAPATAARFYAAALRLLPDAGHDTARLELLSARAQAHAAAGQFAEAHGALLECVDMVPEEAVAMGSR